MPVLGTRKFKLKVGGTDFSASVSKAVVTAGKKDSDFVSFADALAGGARDYKLVVTMRQDTDTTSLWYYAWNSAGTDVAVELWPNGGTVASATTPKVTGTVTITEPDGDFLGGEADASTTAVFVTEVEWLFTAKPVMAVS